MEGKIYDNIVDVEVSVISAHEGSHKVDDAIETLKQSISKFGIQNPIILDGNNEIVAGNAIFKAAKALGYDTVPCIYVSDLTPEQVEQFRIADNKTSEFATWNEKKLRKELSYLQTPTELQPFFDQNIQSMVGFNGDSFNIARQAAQQSNTPVARPIPSPANIPPVDKEKAKEEQKKFRDDLKNIEKSLAAKPSSYFEYTCSKCGKKVIVKMDV